MLNPNQITSLSTAKRLIVAYSGGLDSSVLLHLIKRQEVLANKKILAIYINHGLSPQADAWQMHCQKTCETYGVKFIARRVVLERDNGESLEDQARNLRYQVFSDFIEAGDILVTAHHQNDQAETLLLQLCRGAAIKGLAAMPAQKPFAKGWHYRPLLTLTRADLEAYAQRNHLNWIDDESNNNTSFDRNYLRHEILPKLEKKWPAVIANLARSAELHAEAQTILNIQAAQDLIAIQSNIDSLNLIALATLTKIRQANVLRYWIERNSKPLPSSAVLEEILQQCFSTRLDAKVCIRWQDSEVRRYKSRLYIMSKLPAFDSKQIIPWSNQYALPELNLDKLQGNLTLRFRVTGQRFHPHNRDKSQSLKKLMQEWNIPSWLRDRIPLLYLDETLIAVIGYAHLKNLSPEIGRD